MTSVPSIEAESVLITGVYGAGKSSVAEEIAVALEPEPSDSVPSTSLGSCGLPSRMSNPAN